MKKFKNTALEVIGCLFFYFLVASVLTWPMVAHIDEVVIGGGELGGWFWRQWWHFEEIRALKSVDLGFIGSIEALVSLGRFPETGNILDLLLMSYPLREWVGIPMDHNIKILIILVGNGLCGYVLARTFTDSRLVALGAGLVAIINPLVIQDINKLGLRQTFLWWLLLFPVFLKRARRTGTIIDGMQVGLCYTLISAFYWFYGLFAGMFGFIWLGWHWIKEPPPWRFESRWLTSAAFVGIIGVFLFLMPYFSSDVDDSDRGGVEKLPEVTFLLAYPAYDTIASAPERPTNYRENVLSSLHRGIDSAWPADYVIDPRHGVLAFPLSVFIAGIIFAFRKKRARVWLVIWLVFWLGTLGPFLKIGAQKDTADVIMLGEYVVRLPYVLMFQFIPGMSRMFAPYRMCSMVVVASVILVAIGLDELRSDRRRWISIGFIVATILQPFYRFDIGPLNEFDARPSMWRIPIQISAMKIPQWYQELDPEGWEGIIELPLEQQQDLLCTYQSIHQRKVYRSWATVPAIPTWIRHSGGGLEGRRMRWLAKSEPRGDKMEDLFRSMSRESLTSNIEELQSKDLNLLMQYGSYRWIIVHQRGYYLVDSNQGDILYRDVVRRLSETLALEPERIIEQEAFEWPGKTRHFAVGPAWIPWASQEVQKPVQDMPRRYEMAIFDLYEWEDYILEK
jgi:hypothetical protein